MDDPLGPCKGGWFLARRSGQWLGKGLGSGRSQQACAGGGRGRVLSVLLVISLQLFALLVPLQAALEPVEHSLAARSLEGNSGCY